MRERGKRVERGGGRGRKTEEREKEGGSKRKERITGREEEGRRGKEGKRRKRQEGDKWSGSGGVEERTGKARR